jgi:hypothetical protein
MSWLNFWALPLGLAAAALPILVHLLTRPKPTRLPLSTIRFVQEVVRERRARQRIRDWIVLALRVAAVLLLAAAVARPLLGDRPLVSAADPPGTAVRVVLLDVSQSMAAENRGIRAFERARPLAARHLSYRPGLRANLLLAGASARSVFDRASTNFSTLRDEVARAAVLPERLDVQTALNRAAELLSQSAESQELRRELVVVSDFQRTNWAAADFSALPAGTAIQLESVAPAATPANLALLAVRADGRVEQGRTFRLEVEVGNYASAARQVEAEVVLGESALRLNGLCPAGVKTTLTTELVLAQPGWQTGEARLLAVDDSLAADNVRPLAIEVRPQPTYLLLTRQPTGKGANSSYYLERALVPYQPRQGQASEKVVRADPARVEREVVAAADLVVLDHPGKLPAPLIDLLAALLRRGRGMLYVAAEPIDATNLKLLVQAAGTGLQMPVEFMPPLAGRPRRDLFLADVRHREPPFAIFGEEASAAVAPLRFSGGLATRRLEGALLDDVLASYGDQSACLVLTASGAGALAVLNVDLVASNLPASPVFVPLVGELIGQLLGRDRSRESVACGEPLAVYLPASAGNAAGLRIEPPPQAADDPLPPGELEDQSVGVMWRMPASGGPGVYRVRREDQTVFALASAVAPEEGDLATLASDVVTGRLAAGRQVHFRSAINDEEPRDDTWIWLAVACVVCLLSEVGALRAFRT